MCRRSFLCFRFPFHPGSIDKEKNPLTICNPRIKFPLKVDVFFMNYFGIKVSCFEIGGEFIFAISKFAFEEVNCGHTEMPSKDFNNDQKQEI